MSRKTHTQVLTSSALLDKRPGPVKGPTFKSGLGIDRILRCTFYSFVSALFMLNDGNFHRYAVYGRLNRGIIYILHVFLLYIYLGPFVMFAVRVKYVLDPRENRTSLLFAGNIK